MSDRSQAGVKVAGKAVADGRGAAGAVEAEARGSVVVDGCRAVGVLERENRLRLRQGCEAVQLHHVGRLKMLQVIVHLPVAPCVSRSSHTQQQDFRQQPLQRHFSIEGPSQGCRSWDVCKQSAFISCCMNAWKTVPVDLFLLVNVIMTCFLPLSLRSQGWDKNMSIPAQWDSREHGRVP